MKRFIKSTGRLFAICTVCLLNAPAHGHQSPHAQRGSPTTDREENVYIIKKPPTSATKSADPLSWLKGSYGSDDEPRPVFKNLEEEITATLRSILDNDHISIVAEEGKPALNGQKSYEYSFSVHGIPINGYRVRAVQTPSQKLLIMGDIPKSAYHSALFEDFERRTYREEELKALVTSSLAQYHGHVDASKIDIMTQSSCVVNHSKTLTPATCTVIRYDVFSFYNAVINPSEVLSINPLGHHYCGILENVHIANPSDTLRQFSVSLCDPNGQQNILANEKFEFLSHELENSSCTPPPEPLPGNIPTIAQILLASIMKKYPNWRLHREETNIFDPAEAGSKPKHFSYDPSSPDGNYSKRKIHLFSYLNRMMNWFEALNFKPYDTPIVILISDMKCSLPPTNASYVFYTSSSPHPERKTFQSLQFGFSGNIDCPNKNYPGARPIHNESHEYPIKKSPIRLNNIALDMDIAAHEISHYVISQWITGRPNETYSNDNHTLAIHEGLADYFTYAATEDDCLGNTVCSDSSPCFVRSRCLRVAKPNFQYRDKLYRLFADSPKPAYHHIGQLVSGFLWEVRKDIGKEENLSNNQLQERRQKFDQMVLGSLVYAPQQTVTYDKLIAALLEADQAYTSGAYCQALIDSARNYRFIHENNQDNFRCESAPLERAMSYHLNDTRPPRKYYTSQEYSLECPRSKTRESTGVDFGNQTAYQPDHLPMNPSPTTLTTTLSGSKGGDANSSSSGYAKRRPSYTTSSSGCSDTKFSIMTDAGKISDQPQAKGSSQAFWWLVLLISPAISRLLRRQTAP